MTKKPTACKNCKYMYYKRTGPAKEMWYDFFCKGVTPPKSWNPIEGKLEKGEYHNCRDINVNGQCQYYEGNNETI